MRLGAFTRVEPYRLLFPVGALFAIAGALPWVLHAAGWISYPAVLHRTLMIEGFELCFVLGFLLTAMPGFTHGERCRVWELAAAIAAVAALALGALSGVLPLAHGAFLAAVLLLAIAAGRRVLAARLRPPEEFAFVGLGLLFGLAGGVLQIAEAAGAVSAAAPNFASRLVSLGMVLNLVVGVGSLLVPTFTGMRNPLVIPGVAGAHQRRGRRVFYGAVALALAGAFALEAAGRAGAGAWLRAGGAAAMIFWVWKVWRTPAHRTLAAWAMWSAGWLVALGLLAAAALPRYAIAGLHLTFIGGYGLLTLAIATRVVVSHGRHPLADEGRLASRWALGLLAGALVLRLAAEAAGSGFLHALAASAALWIAAWIAWGFPMVTRAGRPGGPAVPPPPGRTP